jgi:ADP-heptose:LPS heptosyltransferase
VCFDENREVVDLLDMIPGEHVLGIRTTNIVTFVSDCLRHLVSLRKLKLDVAIDMEFFSRASSLLATLSGARATVGFERNAEEGLYKGRLATHPVLYNPHIHTASSFLMLVESLVQDRDQRPLVKVPVSDPQLLRLPRVSASEEEQQGMRERLKAENDRVDDSSRFVILNVNSSDLMPLRRWPLGNYIALGRRFLENPDVFIVLPGVSSELGESLEIARQLATDRCVNMVGKTTIRDLMVLYTLASLMVTNDSGPSQFACLTDMALVTLFGPETPRLYGPIGTHKVAITSGLACSPCVSAYNHRRSKCQDNVCMKAISVDQVWDTCERVLREKDEVGLLT